MNTSLMVERAPSTGKIIPTKEKEKRILGTRLRKHIAEFSSQGEYEDLRPSTKRIAKKAAIDALMTPRRDLYRKILELDAQAQIVPPGSAASKDQEKNKSLGEFRTDKINLYERKKVFNKIQFSTYLTRLDRLLIASRSVVIGLANQRRDVKFDDLIQTPEFKKAHRLCVDIVVGHFRELPHSEQWDPAYKHRDTKPVFTQIARSKWH